ncbi:Dephospho-CoA kinase [Ephemeroptericola cinctiostellae]|uniref:Dephospho-CoA kinase n=2 Tax=Ephemeroptericola cinctiostellae TaxID=2268024 RepID=A0A345D9X2_9BURK|nr:Dephospho-CoA kinase [Ephemeroptericola cinctiostellae]
MVARLLVEQGAALIDLDAIAHELTAANGKAMPSIERAFGAQVVAEDGALNRSVMRDLIFNDSHHKARLEAIIHPLILSTAIELAHLKARNTPLCVLYDIPLLASSTEWLQLLDWIVVVDCSEEVRVQRIRARGPHLTEEMVHRIISSQASTAEMKAVANAVLDNTENDVKHLQLKGQVNILTGYIRRINSSCMK